MIRMFARRQSAKVVAAGTDEFLFGITLPSDSVVHDIKARVKLWDFTETARTLDLITAYAVEGWVLPLLDPDSAQGFDNLWDTLVPKDTDVQVMDLDTGAADATPFYEPGEADWSTLLDVGLRPKRLFHRHRFQTFGDSIFTAFDSATPFNVLWTPGDQFTIHIKKTIRVSQPSVVLFALASPAMDDDTTTAEAALTEPEIGQVKYVGHVLERAMLHLFGVFEAGAETPWEEATALLQKHLDPDPQYEASLTSQAITWACHVEAMIDHSVVGRLDTKSVSMGR